MVVDISGLSYFMPIFGFLFVFVVVYAILTSTKILGDSKWINLLTSFILASIFSVVSSAQEYLQNVTPWFVILMISLFFILLIIGLSQKKIGDVIGTKFVWIIVIVLIIGFLVSAIKIFPLFFGNSWTSIESFMTNDSRTAGAILLLVIGAVVAWVIASGKAK